MFAFAFADGEAKGIAERWKTAPLDPPPPGTSYLGLIPLLWSNGKRAAAGTVARSGLGISFLDSCGWWERGTRGMSSCALAIAIDWDRGGDVAGSQSRSRILCRSCCRNNGTVVRVLIAPYQPRSGPKWMHVGFFVPPPRDRQCCLSSHETEPISPCIFRGYPIGRQVIL
jgi:hypothetical protein